MNWVKVDDLNSPTEGVLTCFTDGTYVVASKEHVSKELGRVKHLLILRKDQAPIVGWELMQRIKNELVGSETWAYEVFPAESSLVNVGNTRHLWCMLDRPLPFGYRFRATDWLDPNLFQPQKVV